MAKQVEKQPVELTEYADCRGVTLDTSAPGVIRGVKVLGLESRNGRDYPKESIARAVSLYEGAKVNVDHAKSPGDSRSYASRIGHIRNVRLESGDKGLYADLHYNPKHALAEQLAWDAEHAPENVGFSHNVLARIGKRGGRSVVEEITRVVSVDLVADPATTRGLFESERDQDTLSEDFDMSETLTLKVVEAEHPDIANAIRENAVKAYLESETAKQQAAELKALKEELDRYKAAEAVAATRTKIDMMLEEAKLPREAVSDIFMATLIEAKDDERRKQLIEDRAAHVAAVIQKPKSKEQVGVVKEDAKAPVDAKAFAERLTG